MSGTAPSDVPLGVGAVPLTGWPFGSELTEGTTFGAMIGPFAAPAELAAAGGETLVVDGGGAAGATLVEGAGTAGAALTVCVAVTVGAAEAVGVAAGTGTAGPAAG
jgi:hypothetical protein